MSKKMIQLLGLIVTISFNLETCNSSLAKGLDQGTTNVPTKTEEIAEFDAPEQDVAEVTEKITDPPSPTATEESTTEPDDSEHKVMVGDVERSYILYAPKELNRSKPIPAVFAFHRYGGAQKKCKKFLVSTIPLIVQNFLNLSWSIPLV